MSVRVEIRAHLPLVDDVLPELLLPLVYQLYGIELGENVVRPGDVVVQTTVLECVILSKNYNQCGTIHLHAEGIVLDIIK